MDWDRLFWVWFGFIVLISIIMLFTDVSLKLLFFLQILVIIGVGIERMCGRISIEKMDKTQRTIYDFWLRTREIKPEIRITKRILDRFR